MRGIALSYVVGFLFFSHSECQEDPGNRMRSMLASLRSKSSEQRGEILEELKGLSANHPELARILISGFLKDQPSDLQEELKMLMTKLPKLVLSLSVTDPAKVGSPLHNHIKVKNISDRELAIVRPRMGSDMGLCFPKYLFSVTRPDGKAQELSSYLLSGDAALLSRDFIVLKPGQEANPIDAVAIADSRLVAWTPTVPGKHEIRLKLDFSSTRPVDWQVGGTVEQKAVLEGLLLKVPKEVFAAKLIVDVQR